MLERKKERKKEHYSECVKRKKDYMEWVEERKKQRKKQSQKGVD